MTGEALHRGIVLLEIEDFGSRPDAVRAALREALYRMAESALAHAGLDPGRCRTEERGDGLLILVPGSVPADRLLRAFLSSLDIDLRTHQQEHNAALRMRLRVGMSHGPVVLDGPHLAGGDVDDLAELLDAGPVRQVLARASRSPLVLVVPDAFFRSVVAGHGSRHTDPAAYGPRDVVTKRGRTLRGWVTVPGYPRPPEAAVEETEQGADAQGTDERRATGSIGVLDHHGPGVVGGPPDAVHAPTHHTPPGPEHDPDDDWPRQTPEP
ncbi:hypothetical protein [Streptomyces hilarionis]|uniref:hypothetical protein n=1 Tax=Streptomyces hilarionis TaxID=2839954 RepID=UPI00211A9336|nr:hypothetical protein [Streptomyces hilarionis]MCQ9132252.1 hypothetical protein [Streptomyces hilarionis]